MKASILNKLQALCERHEELSALLADPGTISNNAQFMAYSKEYAQIMPVVTCFAQYKTAQDNIVTAKDFLADPDPEMQLIAREDLQQAEAQVDKLELELQTLMIPKDPSDDKNVFLEIRAGAGGDEAAIFAGNLFRMYSKYAERQRWQVEVMSLHEGEHGGYKEVIAKIIGQGAYSRLKFESGAHRVQRVPETESQGRIHTSTCTVAILPEADEIAEIELNPSELKIDTYRASGAGGQHVNKTDSAIRITHLPTGIVVECQDERSQHKNRARAMSVLAARLYDAQRSQQQKELAQTRRNLVGTGDRSERIRTYNYPQGRLTDHRINLTLYKLDEVLEGALEGVIEPLNQEHQMDQLAALADES